MELERISPHNKLHNPTISHPHPLRVTPPLATPARTLPPPRPIDHSCPNRKRRILAGYQNYLCALLEAASCIATPGKQPTTAAAAPERTAVFAAAAAAAAAAATATWVTSHLRPSDVDFEIPPAQTHLTPPASSSPPHRCKRSRLALPANPPAPAPPPPRTAPAVPPRTVRRPSPRTTTSNMMGGQCSKAEIQPTHNVGMTPSEAIGQHGRVLTDYEKREILQHSPVWFVGDRARKIHAVEGVASNYGYDDSNSRYLAKKHDHVLYRYEILSGLGKGAFGDVYKAYDHATEQLVALKIIRNEKRFHRQGKIEVKVLEMLRAQDPDHAHSCVHMMDHFLFRSHLCITFEMHHNDLYTELKAGGFAGFEQAYVREIAEDMLGCLRLLYANNIVHADLKPENILLSSPADRRVKIIDYGSSCFVHEKVHTYIQSRYYRSPEVMLGLGYGTSIDMWSVGCILVELTTGSPIFPAKNEHELMLLQTEVLGIPAEYLLNRGTRTDEFYKRSAGGYKPLRFTDRKGRRRVPHGRTLEAACSNQDPAFVDFVRRCLTWDPADRMTPIEALQHPYVTMGSPPVEPLKRCYSEDGLVAMLTRKSHTQYNTKFGRMNGNNAGSDKSLNDSGISTTTDSDDGSADVSMSQAQQPLRSVAV